jgi:hypothetical protein
MKTKTLHRQLHPIHWHGSMYLAIAAILITAMKTSGEMLKTLQQGQVQANAMSSIYLRDAENIHLPIILNNGGRHATVSGT